MPLSSIAMFRCTPPRMAGTVGAIFNSALQLGSSVGSAVVTSITSTIDNKAPIPNPHPYAGRSASFWFVLGAVVLEAVSVAIFYQPKRVEFSESEETKSEPSVANIPASQPNTDEKV